MNRNFSFHPLKMYLEYLDTKRTRKYKMQCATYRLLTWTYQSLTRWRTRASSNFVDRSLAMSSPGRRQDRGGRAFQDFLRPVWDERFFENLLSKKKVGNYFFSLQPMCSFVISDDLWLFLHQIFLLLFHCSSLKFLSGDVLLPIFCVSFSL